MIPWFLESPERLTLERGAFDELQREDWFRGHAWHLNGSRLSVEVELTARGCAHTLRLDYPPCFPISVPTVTPINEPSRLSAHQYGPRGELCLEWGPDNWHPTVTGSQLVESAHRLLEGESARAEGDQREIPSRHSTTFGQDIRAWRRFVIGPRVKEHLVGLAQRNAPVPARFRGIFEGDCLLIHLDALHPDEPDLHWPNPDVPSAVLADGWEIRGFAISTQQPLPRPGAAEDAELRTLLAGDGLEHLVAEHDGHIAFLWTHPDDGVAFAHRIGKSGTAFQLSQVISFSETSPADRTPPVYADLSNRRVAIIGLGSVGAHIAMSLARVGVRNFLLVDDDVFLPENLIRHALDWRAAGAHKVDATASAMRRIASDLTISTERHGLDGQCATAAAAAVDAAIASCDVAVDATASPDGFNRLARLVAQSKVPLVWVELFAGGIGGMIARARPGLDPDPFTMRHQIAAWTAEQNAPVPEVVNDYTARGAGGVPWIATDADVRAIAAHGTELVLDTLRSAGTESAFPANVYFIGLRQGWIFTQPFDVRPLILVPSAEEAPPRLDPQSRRRTLEFLSKLISESDDPNSSAS